MWFGQVQDVCPVLHHKFWTEDEVGRSKRFSFCCENRRGRGRGNSWLLACSGWDAGDFVGRRGAKDVWVLCLWLQVVTALFFANYRVWNYDFQWATFAVCKIHWQFATLESRAALGMQSPFALACASQEKLVGETIEHLQKSHRILAPVEGSQLGLKSAASWNRQKSQWRFALRQGCNIWRCRGLSRLSAWKKHGLKMFAV